MHCALGRLEDDLCQGADGPLLDSCVIPPTTNNDHSPIIEQCQACQATVILKVQIGKDFTITSASFAKGVSIEGTVWHLITSPDAVGVIKAILTSTISVRWGRRHIRQYRWD